MRCAGYLGLMLVVGGCYSGHSIDAGGDGDDQGSASVGEDGSGESGDTGEPEDVDAVGISGMRRLSAAEYEQTLIDLLGADLVDPELLLPVDERTPFDNDFTLQIASQALIDGADLLASDLATAIILDTAIRDRVVGCTPSGASDDACLRDFIATFGRKVLRRPLTDEQVTALAAFGEHAEEAGDFYVAVDSVLRAMFQHPEFLYRIEIGEPTPDDPAVFRLNNNEVATRLSYFLWGSSPDDTLLDLADAGELGSPADVRAAAATMVEDPRAKDRIARFHSMWLGYETLPLAPDLAEAMEAETDALLARYLFDEDRPWQDLLRATETFLDDDLAAHYGLPAPGSTDPVWVDYGDSGRQGLLSHGSYLTVGAKFEDTSPTQRGIIVRTRLLCQTIPDPPPDVNVDEPPEADPDACKEERYSVHAAGGCAGCHALIDPVGFGLENYDAAGVFREFEVDRPDCPISGVGSLDGDQFEGPAGLADLLLATGEIDRCVTTQLYRFAMGRYELEQDDENFIDLLLEQQPQDELQFEQLMLDFVESPGFRYRREEGV